MIAIAGSAYTYTYATLAASWPGLSLDLVLEYLPPDWTSSSAGQAISA